MDDNAYSKVWCNLIIYDHNRIIIHFCMASYMVDFNVLNLVVDIHYQQIVAIFVANLRVILDSSMVINFSWSILVLSYYVDS